MTDFATQQASGAGSWYPHNADRNTTYAPPSPVAAAGCVFLIETCASTAPLSNARIKQRDKLITSRSDGNWNGKQWKRLFVWNKETSWLPIHQMGTEMVSDGRDCIKQRNKLITSPSDGNWKGKRWKRLYKTKKQADYQSVRWELKWWVKGNDLFM